MEITSTLFLVFASWVAKEQEVVVLPTPPFPPTKTLQIMSGKLVLPFDRFIVDNMIQGSFWNIEVFFHHCSHVKTDIIHYRQITVMKFQIGNGLIVKIERYGR